MSNETSALSEGALVARTKIHVEAHDTASGVPGYYAPGDKLPGDLSPETIAEFVKHGSAEQGVPYVNDGPTLTPELLERLGGLLGIKATVRVEKYEDTHAEGDSEARAADPAIAPDDLIQREHNLLTIGGASLLWQAVIGNGTVTAAQALTYLNNAQAALGVGDSTTAAADTQTNLQAVTNAVRVAMDVTYPTHTDSTGTAGSKSITFKSTFGTAAANFAWNEWGLFNNIGTASPPTGGRMFNRKQEALGTKTNTATWTLTITLSLA